MSQHAEQPTDGRRFGKVGVLLGGSSSEREVSLRSGAAVLRALQESGVDAHAFDPAQRSLGELESAGFARVFLILHGRQGEDGAMQGVLETLRIPYTGSGVQASAIAMDKVTTKRLWVPEGIPTPAWRRVERGAALPEDIDTLGTALIVKPVSEGSTFGVTKIDAPDAGTPAARRAALRRGLDEALDIALRYDGAALIEERILGRELTCAVLGEGAQARALPLVEIRAPGANYDYHNKYFGNDTQYLCPAPLDAALSAHIQDVCVQAYRAVGARGWGRIDVMLREGPAGPSPCLLELNTAPGMTDHSLVPMAARAHGMDFTQLVLHILEAARLDGQEPPA